MISGRVKMTHLDDYIDQKTLVFPVLKVFTKSSSNDNKL